MKDTRIASLDQLVQQGNALVAAAKAGSSANDVWQTVAVGESVRKNAAGFTNLRDTAQQHYEAVNPGKTMSHAAQVASAMILAAAGHEDD
ncbi:hypothetical protein XI41_25550, partial [Salmonella enterica subsp. enterica serovar Derby]|nr:hypothetical protein [Salmonella enterica subsp. enterica serovar Derby]HCJ8476951.1 hypothetical protein [Escherichia coli]